MNKKPSNKDLKDWKNFLESKEKVHNKDNVINQTKIKEEATIDLHGFSLDQANIKVEKFITECFEKKVLKLNIITGKGLRSKNSENPYVSEDLSILKNSVPEFVRSSSNLMKIIKHIKDASVEDGGEGAFYIYLKKFKE